MTSKDIQQLQIIIRTEIGNALEEVVLPELVTLKTDVAELRTDVAELRTDVAELRTDVAHIKGQLNTRYPDKAYLDDKINGLRGDILAARKQDSARLDKHILFHYKKGHLTDKEIEELERMRPFAPLPA